MYDFDLDRSVLEPSKKFRNTWMRKWGWDHHDLREALRDAYRVERIGKSKYEVYVRKKGGKKLILVYDQAWETVFVITGAEG